MNGNRKMRNFELEVPELMLRSLRYLHTGSDQVLETVEAREETSYTL